MRLLWRAACFQEPRGATRVPLSVLTPACLQRVGVGRCRSSDSELREPMSPPELPRPYSRVGMAMREEQEWFLRGPQQASPWCMVGPPLALCKLEPTWQLLGPQLLHRNRQTVLGKVHCFHWEGTGDCAGAVALKGARLQGGSRQILGRHWDAYFEQQPTAGQQFVDKAHLKSAGGPASMGNGHWRSQKGGETTSALATLAYVDAHRWARTNPRPSSCRGPKSAHDYVHTVRTQGPRADFFPRAWPACPWHFWSSAGATAGCKSVLFSMSLRRWPWIRAIGSPQRPSDPIRARLRFP